MTEFEYLAWLALEQPITCLNYPKGVEGWTRNMDILRALEARGLVQRRRVQPAGDWFYTLQDHV